MDELTRKKYYSIAGLFLLLAAVFGFWYIYSYQNRIADLFVGFVPLFVMIGVIFVGIYFQKTNPTQKTATLVMMGLLILLYMVLFFKLSEPYFSIFDRNPDEYIYPVFYYSLFNLAFSVLLLAIVRFTDPVAKFLKRKKH